MVQLEPPGVMSGSASTGHSVYGGGSSSSLYAMGSLQQGMSAASRGARLGQQPGGPGSMLSGSGSGLHSQGLAGRLTPTHLSSRPAQGGHMQGLQQPGVSLLQSAPQGRNPLFSRIRGDGSVAGSGPNTFDPSEFPSLAGAGGSGPGLAGRPNYVGMVKQPTEHQSEFTMSNEDFPALPGATASDPKIMFDQFADPPGGGNLLDSMNKLNSSQQLTPEQELAKQHNSRKGIQTSPDGLVTNIPANMVVDQFGMIGLLTFIRAAETDPNLVSLALGADLTTLGLNLNSDVNLFPTFGGPWADTPCRPQDIDFHVPHEYLTNTAIRDKLAPVKLNRYKDDILFYMFYTNVGDVLQMAAAAELYNRDWRYHKEERVWITRAPGMAPSEKTTTYERGTYYFFDVGSWRKVPKEFHLDYDKLEDRPSLPTTLPGGPAAVQHQLQNQVGGVPGGGVGVPGGGQGGGPGVGIQHSQPAGSPGPQAVQPAAAL